jgi:hypothetical protein
MIQLLATSRGTRKLSRRLCSDSASCGVLPSPMSTGAPVRLIVDENAVLGASR